MPVQKKEAYENLQLKIFKNLQKKVSTAFCTVNASYASDDSWNKVKKNFLEFLKI